jgi:flavorubredoxin
MFSYLPDQGVLISNDAFGQNWAGNERFDDQVELKALLRESAHYYANIILPFSAIVQKVLGKIRESRWEIDMIAPDHGLVWRSHADAILEAYDKMSKQVLAPKAVIFYDTMWQSTEAMAKAIGNGLNEQGVSPRLMHLKAYHHSDVMLEVLDAAAVICGSPTHNNGVMPLVMDMLTYMRGLRPSNRVGAAFGSYGWSGEAVKNISDLIEEMGFEVPVKGVRAKYRPGHEELAQCKELGRKVGEAVNKRLASYSV